MEHSIPTPDFSNIGQVSPTYFPPKAPLKPRLSPQESQLFRERNQEESFTYSNRLPTIPEVDDDAKALDEDDEVMVWLDYTSESHAITGPFKNKYQDLRINEFRPHSRMHYNSKLYVGKGWLFDKPSLVWLEDLLRKNSIEYQVTNFDPNIRKAAILERQRRRS